MKEVIKRNPLTLIERTKITRVLGHDVNNLLTILNGAARHGSHNDEEKRKYNDIATFISECNSMVVDLASKDRLCVSPHDSERFNDGINSIGTIAGMDITIDIRFKDYLITNVDLMKVVFYNLAKNSKQSAAKSISLKAKDFEGTPKGIYSRYNAPSDGQFVLFDFFDDGKGFLKNKNIETFLQDGASSKEKGGFGLYFVTLACKYLGATLDIKSKHGNTHVCIYHPKGI